MCVLQWLQKHCNGYKNIIAEQKFEVTLYMAVQKYMLLCYFV